MNYKKSNVTKTGANEYEQDNGKVMTLGNSLKDGTAGAMEDIWRGGGQLKRWRITEEMEDHWRDRGQLKRQRTTEEIEDY